MGKAFTNDQAVIDLIATMMPILWLYGTVDAVKAVGMGVLRGSGRPSITVYLFPFRISAYLRSVAISQNTHLSSVLCVSFGAL